MHVLFLTDNFPPEANAPASRTFEHCREWVRTGHDVTVITCAPNFPQGKVFEGYRNRPFQRETIEGIKVIRVWSYITANEGFIKRILDYVSFMLTGSLAALFVRKVDVVVATSPQFFTACAGWFIGAVKRVPWVFELRDIWPESIKAVEAMNDGLAITLLEKLEMFLYRQASRIITVTHAFRKTLGNRGIDTGKIDVVTNGVDLSQFSPKPKDAELVKHFNLQGKFVAGYIGTHGMAHALETLLEAARRLQAMPDGKDICILLLGDGARKPQLKEQAREMQLDNLLFIDSVAKGQVARYWSLLDISIIHLRKTELFGTVIPSKLFECMGMGIPVLHGVAGESADIVERKQMGIVFEPENVDELVAGLLRLHDDKTLYAQLRQNAIAAAPSYDRKNLAMDMLAILARLAGTK